MRSSFAGTHRCERSCVNSRRAPRRLGDRKFSRHGMATPTTAGLIVRSTPARPSSTRCPASSCAALRQRGSAIGVRCVALLRARDALRLAQAEATAPHVATATALLSDTWLDPACRGRRSRFERCRHYVGLAAWRRCAPPANRLVLLRRQLVHVSNVLRSAARTEPAIHRRLADRSGAWAARSCSASASFVLLYEDMQISRVAVLGRLLQGVVTSMRATRGDARRCATRCPTAPSGATFASSRASRPAPLGGAGGVTSMSTTKAVRSRRSPIGRSRRLQRAAIVPPPTARAASSRPSARSAPPTREPSSRRSGTSG